MQTVSILLFKNRLLLVILHNLESPIKVVHLLVRELSRNQSIVDIKILVWQIVLRLPLSNHVVRVFEPVKTALNPLQLVIVVFLVLTDLIERVLELLSNLSILVHDSRELVVFVESLVLLCAGLCLSSRLLVSLSLKVLTAGACQATHSVLENATAGQLVVVLGSFGLQDVLVAGKSVPVIHITQPQNKLVHHFGIDLFLTVNLFRFLFDNVVEAVVIRQQELIINHKVVSLLPHELLLFDSLLL